MKSSGIPLSSFPRAVQERILAEDRRMTASRPPAPAGNRLRQSSVLPNKMEAAFGEWLAANNAKNGALIHFQKVTLRLANGCRYTPDYVMYGGGQTYAYEVKGFMREDAAVKLKVAAANFPWIRFFLISRRRTGPWESQLILP